MLSFFNVQLIESIDLKGFLAFRESRYDNVIVQALCTKGLRVILEENAQIRELR